MAEFDASLIYKGLAGGGENIAGGVADLIKKRKHEEEQNAFNQTAFQTLATAKGPDGQPLLTEEEKQRFTSGNLNARNGITNAGMSRLASVFQIAKEKQAMELQAAHQQFLGVQMQAAKKGMEDNPYAQQPVYDGSGNQVGIYDDRGTPHYFPGIGRGVDMQPPVTDAKTGLMWNGRVWVKPPSSADAWAKNVAVARGRVKSDGTFDNNYAGAENGDMVKLMTPQGKEVVIPWSVHQSRQQTSPPAPQAASGAAPVNPQDKFIAGKQYKDAQGNVATYMGNGQWQ